MFFHEIIPERFFSILASKNKEIYLTALLLIHRYYRQELLLRKTDIIALFIHHLEERMMDLVSDEGDELVLERNLSSRAHYLLRKFVATGWLEREYQHHSFEEFLVVPEYAAVLLGALQDLLEDNPSEYNSLVYSTYSCLGMADSERDDFMLEALLQSYGATGKLKENLRRLYNNMRRYYQKLQQKEAIQDIMQEHFDVYQVLILDRMYHPLKTFDSIPRYKTRILHILRSWLADSQVVEHLTQLMIKKGFYVELQDDNRREEALNEVLRMLGEMIDTYETIEITLREIDKKNADYTKALVERTKYLLNEDRGVRGKLVEVLKQASILEKQQQEVDILQEGFLLFKQNYVDEDSLYRVRQKRIVEEGTFLAVSSTVSQHDLESELQQFVFRVQESLTQQDVINFITDFLKDKEQVHSQDILLANNDDFIKLILAVVKSTDVEMPFVVHFLEGYIDSNGYRIPKMVFTPKKEESSGVA